MWVKGETSGATQHLVRVDVDCDRDTLRFTVRQREGFCHSRDRTCWGHDHGITRLERRLREISRTRPVGSNTVSLLDDQGLLDEKLLEETRELTEPGADVAAETADLLYFALVKAVAAGVRLAEIEEVLDRRERRMTRRPMGIKELE
jgi:phosphoribosyl-ATP pyrophosphohydrolase/phosphoribosyl-AMP cyclohydrolase/histidinol dehydrogenase